MAEQCAEEALRGVSVAPLLQENIQRGTMLVYRAPEPVLLACDAHRHLVQMPSTAEVGFSLAQLQGVVRTEPSHPAAHCFVADLNATLSKQFFYIPEAQGKAQVQPDGIGDYLAGEAVAAVRVWRWGGDYLGGAKREQ